MGKVRDELSSCCAEIVNDSLRNAVLAYLDTVPDWMAERSASSTGKNHPEMSNGPGGLMRHTIAAFRVLRDLMDSLPQYDDVEYRSAYYAAIILHDTKKYVNESDKYIVHEHPLLAANAFREFCKKRRVDQSLVEKCCNIIETHMGRWTTNSHSNVELTKPRNFEELMVHWADYISSRKYCNMPDLMAK
jgi:hypothetical protein